MDNNLIYIPAGQELDLASSVVQEGGLQGNIGSRSILIIYNTCWATARSGKLGGARGRPTE